MENLFERATALIGKTPEDKEYEQFVADIGELPHIGPRKGHVYKFANSGLSLNFEDTFVSVTFHLNDKPSRERPTYGGDLPGGIQREDLVETMRKKIGGCGGNFLSHEETYYVPKVVITLKFDADHQLTEITAV